MTIKPCPFCGELPTTRFWVNTVTRGISIEFCCDNCSVKKRLDIECKKTADVELLQDGLNRITETWNRRVNDEQSD